MQPAPAGATLRLDEAEPVSLARQPARAQRQGCGMSLAVMAIAAIVVLAIVGLGLAGVYYGLRDRSNVQHQAAEEYYNKGVVYLEQGQPELAIAQFEMVLRLEPNHSKALAKLDEARQAMNVPPTATPTVASAGQMLAKTFDDLRAAQDRQDWAQVFVLVDRIIAQDPTYRRSEVDQILFNACYQSGQDLVEKDRIKEAISLFDRALELQPDNAQVQQARKLAVLYMNGMAYWGADWATTLENLTPLYSMAPDYKDVRQRTHDAHVYYGDLLAEREDWCGAEQQYAQALEITPGSALFDKRQDALTRCNRQPSPQPDQTLTPGAAVNAPSGTFGGQVTDHIEVDHAHMFIRGKVLDKNNKGVQGTRVQIQAWNWKAVAVTDGNGQCSFDGLNNPVTYTLTLLDLPSLPLDVQGQWGDVTWVDFHEAR